MTENLIEKLNAVAKYLQISHCAANLCLPISTYNLYCFSARFTSESWRSWRTGRTFVPPMEKVAVRPM